MRIALIDVDGHNFPNLPLMKLSAWHKQNEDQVEWYDPLTAWLNTPDRVYIKDYDDDICYGYCGRSDCAMFKDFKQLIKDGADTEMGIEWY